MGTLKLDFDYLGQRGHKHVAHLALANQHPCIKASNLFSASQPGTYLPIEICQAPWNWLHYRYSPVPSYPTEHQPSPRSRRMLPMESCKPYGPFCPIKSPAQEPLDQSKTLVERIYADQIYREVSVQVF